MANKFLLLISLGLLAYGAEARDLCKVHNLGWHFYCDDKKQKPEAVEGPTPSAARQELSSIQEKLESLKAMAVMYPTHENVRSYIAFQQEQLERANKFASHWRDVLRMSPELDYMVKTPLNTIGNSLRAENKYKDQSKVLSKLNTRYGLFFFYSAACNYCQKFSPILKVFADTYRIAVMPVSMDGGVLPEWPNSEINQGQAQKFGIEGKPVPATMLFDKETERLIPVGYGLLAVSELEERIYELTKVE